MARGVKLTNNTITARMRLARRLRIEREAAEMTQEVFARLVSEAIDGPGATTVKEHLIRCVESGDMTMPWEFIPYLARVLGITVPRLLGEIVPSRESMPLQPQPQPQPTTSHQTDSALRAA